MSGVILCPYIISLEGMQSRAWQNYPVRPDTPKEEELTDEIRRGLRGYFHHHRVTGGEININ